MPNAYHRRQAQRLADAHARADQRKTINRINIEEHMREYEEAYLYAYGTPVKLSHLRTWIRFDNGQQAVRLRELKPMTKRLWAMPDAAEHALDIGGDDS